MSSTACGSTAAVLPRAIATNACGNCERRASIHFDAGVQYAHKEELRQSFLERIHQVIKKTRPDCLVCPQNQGTYYGLANRAPFVDYSSQEALFTDAVHYGYHYFPTVIRYARGFGDTVPWLYGLFQGFLGRLRRPEVAGADTHGSRRLCLAGRAMRHRRPGASRRPARAGDLPRDRAGLSAHRTDRAVPGTGGAGDGGGAAGERGCPCNEVNYGWVKLLTESQVQFDIVEREAKWEERYGLVVLPENFWVDQAMASRLQAFIAGGGAVIAAHTSAVLAGTEKSWLEPYGLHYCGHVALQAGLHGAEGQLHR